MVGLPWRSPPLRLLLLLLLCLQAGSNKGIKLNPFALRSWLVTLPQLLHMLFWLVWTGVLSFSILPVLVQQQVNFIPGLSSWLNDKPLWIIPAAVHVVLVWGGAMMRQRAGYVTSWSGVWLDWQRRFGLRGQFGKGATAAAHADCAVDRAIDALFYPSSNLAVDKQRSLSNALLWVAVMLLKVAFEFFCIVQPLTNVMLEVSCMLCSIQIHRCLCSAFTSKPMLHYTMPYTMLIGYARLQQPLSGNGGNAILTRPDHSSPACLCIQVCWHQQSVGTQGSKTHC